MKRKVFSIIFFVLSTIIAIYALAMFPLIKDSDFRKQQTLWTGIFFASYDILYILNCSIISKIAVGKKLSIRQNYKIYHIFRFLHFVLEIVWMLCLIIPFVSHLSYNDVKQINLPLFIFLFACGMLYIFVYILLTHFYFLERMDKKLHNLIWIKKGTSLSDVEEMLNKDFYYTSNTIFIVKPFKSGKEVRKYELYFDENNNFIKYESSYERKWYTTVYH